MTEIALSVVDTMQMLNTTYPSHNSVVNPSDSVATVTWRSGDSMHITSHYGVKSKWFIINVEIIWHHVAMVKTGVKRMLANTNHAFYEPRVA